MKNTKHTPRKWTVVPPTRNSLSRAMVSDEHGATVYDAPLTTETATNAHLIAAAPDMLEALEEFMGDTYMKARAAVQKARGEA